MNRGISWTRCPQLDIPPIIQTLTNQAVGTLRTRYPNWITAAANTLLHFYNTRKHRIDNKR